MQRFLFAVFAVLLAACQPADASSRCSFLFGCAKSNKARVHQQLKKRAPQAVQKPQAKPIKHRLGASLTSTINPFLPGQGSALNSAAIRGNFAAAASDINVLYGLNATNAGSITSLGSSFTTLQTNFTGLQGQFATLQTNFNTCCITTLSNPMTSPGDMIVGGTAGAGQRLAVGGTGSLLTGGASPAWSTNLTYLSSVLAVGGTASNTQTGDISVSRSANTGAIFFGTDGNADIFRNGSTNFSINSNNVPIQLGNLDIAAPFAQTLQVQSVVAGTSNAAGQDWTFNASKSTGNAAGGRFVWQVTPAGSSGTGQNALVQGMILDSTVRLTLSASSSLGSPVIGPSASGGGIAMQNNEIVLLPGFGNGVARATSSGGFTTPSFLVGNGNVLGFGNAAGAHNATALQSGFSSPSSNTVALGNGTANDTTGTFQAKFIQSPQAAGGVGYTTGAGGAVTQATSRTTGVTLNNVTGAITLVSATGSASFQTFTVTNSSVAATDVPHVVQKSGADKYQIFVTNVAAGSFAITFATTGGATIEQPVFNFAIIKGSAN